MTANALTSQPARPAAPCILVIDDEVAIRTMLRRTLEREGFAVVDAPDGRAGIAASRDQPPDVVLTDLFMPDKDGIEVIQEVRSLWSQTRIIAMTGGQPQNSFGSIVQPAALLLGADRVLLKPFDQRTLLSAIEDALSLRDARQPSK
jgi:DNA-binding response OmpR family regulator